MGIIKASGDLAFRDFVVDGSPGSGANKPDKSEIRAIFKEIDKQIDDLSVSGDTVTKATWAQLSSVVGTRAGQRGYVEADTGTHTDPVVAGSVMNQGVYAWSVSPAGWQWMSAGITDNALTINRGKNYPFKAVPRNNVTSDASAIYNAALLDVKIFGAKKGKYYRIEYYGNGNATYGFQLLLSEYDATTYHSGNPTGKVIIGLNDIPATSIEAGSIVTRTLFGTKDISVAIQFTIDRSKAAEPSVWLLNNNSRPAYSWIIDPSCYDYTPFMDGEVHGAAINRGRVFPLKIATRDGVTSAADPTVKDWLLDAKVIGALPGKYYRVNWFLNGGTIGGITGEDRWIVAEYDIDGYETASSEVRLHDYTDPEVKIDRSIGVQTISINCAGRPGTQFNLTIDPSGLPPYGTFVQMHHNNLWGSWSWIIDPSLYYASLSSSGQSDGQAGYGPMMVSMDAGAKTAEVTFSHGSALYRIVLRPTGFNSLFNVSRLMISDGPNIDTAVFSTISSFDTDWIPPMIVQSTSSPVTADAPRIFTGGNHGSSGSASGEKTAIMMDWSCTVDERVLAGDYSGTAEKIVFSWINDVFAYNTIEFERPVIRQHFTAVVRPSSIEVWAEYEVLEPCVMKTDYGLQMVESGYSSIAFYGDNGSARRPQTELFDANPKSAAPDVWAAVLAHAGHGFMASWMDRSYEAGDGRYVPLTAPYIRRSSNKVYHGVVREDIPFTTGNRYRWHGGYVWSPARIVSGDLDSAFIYRSKDKLRTAWAILSAGAGNIKLPADLVGKTLNTGIIPATARFAVVESTYAYKTSDIV